MDDFTDSDIDGILQEEGIGGGEPEPAQEQTPAEAEYEYTASGKPIKEPISKILQRASQGYHYSQQMAEFNKQKQEFDSRYQRYNEIDQYSQQNPDWWKYVENNWNNRQNPQQMSMQQTQQQPGLDPNLEQVISPLKQELNELKSFKNRYETEQEIKQQQAEDQALREEMESIQKIYPNLDFKTPQASGKSLELEVLEHAQREGIPKFKAAFNDYYLDKLKSLEYERGKEAVAKDIQKKTKLGLLGSSPTPIKQFTQSKNHRNASYSDLADEALAEM